MVCSSLHCEFPVKHAECFAGAVHAVMRDPQLLVLRPVLCDLLEIGRPREEEDDVSRGRERFVEGLHAVWLHHVQVKDLVVGVCRTCVSSAG